MFGISKTSNCDMLNLAGTKKSVEKRAKDKRLPTERMLKKQEEIDGIPLDTQCCAIPSRTPQPRVWQRCGHLRSPETGSNLLMDCFTDQKHHENAEYVCTGGFRKLNVVLQMNCDPGPGTMVP